MEQACVARPRIGSKSLKRIYALVSFLHVKNILLWTNCFHRANQFDNFVIQAVLSQGYWFRKA